MRREILINQGTITVDVHNRLRNALNNRESKKDKKNHHSIHTTLIISVMYGMVRNKRRDSDVDWRIISLQIFRNHTLQIIQFTVTRKSLKSVHTDQIK